MTFDYYAALHDPAHEFGDGSVLNLSSGLVDRVATDFADGGSEEARRKYQQQASGIASLALPDDLGLDADWTPTIPGWFSLSIEFEFQTPWYSKDDRPFHVLHNPVRKDRVFGAPFMSAASWKGLLRWACRMEAGLLAHLEEHENKLDGWTEPDWILHLFGNEKGEDEDFSRGALAFRPTWFDKVGFEVINPHDRSRRAGTQPIVYEVVPPASKGLLRQLYAPLLGRAVPSGTFEYLFAAIEKLLTVYGFSAKRTAGWGIATIEDWHLGGVGGRTSGDLKTVQEALAQLDRVRFAGGKP